VKAPERPRITERQLQSGVIDLAQRLHWRVAHFRSVPVRRADGSVRHMTPVQADGVGFPDLVLARGTRLLFVELKSERGVPRPEQVEWMNAFAAVALENPGVETHLWKPRHYFDGTIEEALA